MILSRNKTFEFQEALKHARGGSGRFPSQDTPDPTQKQASHTLIHVTKINKMPETDSGCEQTVPVTDRKETSAKHPAI